MLANIFGPTLVLGDQGLPSADSTLDPAYVRMPASGLVDREWKSGACQQAPHGECCSPSSVWTRELVPSPTMITTDLSGTRVDGETGWRF